MRGVRGGVRVGVIIWACLMPLPAAFGATVRVSMTLDDADAVLVPGQTTTLHLFAEVIDGQPGNGVYGYALNVVENAPPIVRFESIMQFGDLWAFVSGPGLLTDFGLIDVYGGDGGFWIDPNRGIGEPFEILAIDLSALQLGDVTITAFRASNAFHLGAPNGFLLQTPGDVDVDFGSGLTIHVVPEPATAALLLITACGSMVAKRRRLL